MEIDKVILELAGKGSITNMEVTKALGGQFSRVTISHYLQNLVKDGKLKRIGAGRSVHYLLNEVLEYLNKGLEEHKVLIDLESKNDFLRLLPENLQSIFAYAFSEMFNNAIEHSQSKKIQVLVRNNDSVLTFIITDSGVGVFRNIMKKRGLKSEEEAIQDLLKGKVTTAPKAHSGEGFFLHRKRRINLC
jgi:anti-sigma regulatory factor (Ser/Thr protein kinase)